MTGPPRERARRARFDGSGSGEPRGAAQSGGDC